MRVLATALWVLAAAAAEPRAAGAGATGAAAEPRAAGAGAAGAGAEPGAGIVEQEGQQIHLEAVTEPRAWSPELVVVIHSGGVVPSGAGLDVTSGDAAEGPGAPEQDAAHELALLAAPPTRVRLTPDTTRQGFYVAGTTGPARRFLDVELLLVDGPAETTLWRRVVPAEAPAGTTLSFFVEQDGPRASRVAWLPWAGSGATAGNEVSLLVAFGWGGLCAAYVFWLARPRPAA